MSLKAPVVSSAAPMAPFASRIGRVAIRALYRELAAYPTPGLVSLVDSGSHMDMDAKTFMRSLFALRHYFCVIAAAGASQSPFSVLQTLGRGAETRMLVATQGVNTHRGAIFSLGLLAAAAGLLRRTQSSLTAETLCAAVGKHWGRAILDSASSAPSSHGSLMALHHGTGGARAEAAAGFPHLLQIGLPALQRALARTGDGEAAIVESFFSLMAVIPDTNLLYRAGPRGLAFANSEAQQFLDEGGVARRDWRQRAAALHQTFVNRNLSPGGSADLLAATLFVHQIAGR